MLPIASIIEFFMGFNHGFQFMSNFKNDYNLILNFFYRKRTLLKAYIITRAKCFFISWEHNTTHLRKKKANPITKKKQKTII